MLYEITIEDSVRPGRPLAWCLGRYRRSALSARRCYEVEHAPTLYLACTQEAPAEVILPLLEKLPTATKGRNSIGQTPLDLARNYSAPQDVQMLLQQMPCMYFMYEDGIDYLTPKDIMYHFVINRWQEGVVFVLYGHPDVAQTIIFDVKVVPNFLHFIGCCCEMATMRGVPCNTQDLSKDL